MSQFISPQRAHELLKIKQSRVKKAKPAQKLPERIRGGLLVKFNWDTDEWEVRDAGKVLFSAESELECRQQRDRLEDERG